MSDQAKTKPSNLNIPNLLTALRIALVPFFGAALLADGGDSVTWRCVAWAIFVVAMITDNIDGHIARTRGLITDFGKIADPIADKLITGMAFVGLSIVGDIWWWVTIVVLVREWSVTLLRISVLRRVVIPADNLGKLKTTFQAIALGGLLLPFRDPDLASWMETPGELLFYAAQVCLGVAVLLTVWSGIDFFRKVWQQRHQLRTTPAER